MAKGEDDGGESFGVRGGHYFVGEAASETPNLAAQQRAQVAGKSIIQSIIANELLRKFACLAQPHCWPYYIHLIQVSSRPGITYVLPLVWLSFRSFDMQVAKCLPGNQIMPPPDARLVCSSISNGED